MSVILRVLDVVVVVSFVFRLSIIGDVMHLGEAGVGASGELMNVGGAC